MICSKCKKRPAVLFVQRMENGKAVNEGLCWVCAKEAGLPQISDIMNQMGITEDEMEAMSQQLMEFADGDSFEPGGADTMPNFLQNLFGSEKPTVSKEQPKSSEEKKGAKKKEKPKYKFLDSYCTNLCQKARDGQLDRIVGRENEIYRVVPSPNLRYYESDGHYRR